MRKAAPALASRSRRKARPPGRTKRLLREEIAGSAAPGRAALGAHRSRLAVTPVASVGRTYFRLCRL